MTEYIGNVPIPVISPSGTFPIIPDYGYGMAEDPEVAIHQFGSANAKIEQRFLLGAGAKKFSIRKSYMNETDRAALRTFWETNYGPYGAFTYNAPNDDGAGTTAYTVRFANEPLTWEFLLDAISTTGITLIEIPASDPSYTLGDTVTRFPSSTLKTALLSQVQEMIPLLKISPRTSGYPVIYVSDRRCTIGGQLYLARLLDWDGIQQSLGNEADDAQFTFGNADRVMTALVNDTNLTRATVEFSLYHVGSQIKLDLWKGEISDWTGDEGPVFQMTAADGIYELTLPYPTRKVSRTCWKVFDDGNGCPYTSMSSGLDTTHFPTVDATKCDKSYDGANGCIAHGMKKYFGGIIAVPQSVMLKDNSTGTLGFGRSSVTSTSIVSDSVYDLVVPEIYTKDLSFTDVNGYVTTGMSINCKIAAGRAEIDFYEAIGIVSEGPITFNTHGAVRVSSTQQGTPYEIPTLDGQYDHMFPAAQGRMATGTDPAGGGDFFSLDEGGNLAGSNWRLAYYGGNTYNDNFSAGLAFLTIRRKDTGSLNLTIPGEHSMTCNVTEGIKGWVWTAAGARTWQVLGNPVWIVINMLLRALGLRFASAATAEGYFDVDAAIAAAAINDTTVVKIIGIGSETQFIFSGILQEQKPLRDWIQEVLMNCLAYYTFSFGKLKLGIRENSSAVEAFTIGNIIFGSLKLSALKPAFNHLTANFADIEYYFAANSVEIYDIDHAKLIGGATAPLFLKSNVNLCGTYTKSQAARIITTRLREELGGINATQWAAGRQLSYKTTVLALNTEPGMVCSMTHPDMPAGVLSGTPTPNYGEFRVQAWKLNKDYSIEINGNSTVDEMYDLTVGPKPADVVASPLPVESIIAGASGASGLQAFVNADDATIPLGTWVAECAGETTYQETIKGEAYWLSPALPSQGPYAAQRAAFGAATLETGTCTVQGGVKRIAVTRTAAPSMVDKVLCVYVPGADPDAQLSGQIITAEGTNYLEVDPAFQFSGNFSYAIIQPWWDTSVSVDVGYKWVPVAQFIPINSTTHKTPPLDAAAGTYYVTRASVNQYGLGTLLTCGPITILAAGGATPHVADDLAVNSISAGLRLRIGALAAKWNSDIDQAEFRAQLFSAGFSAQSVDLRTVAEGGTLAHDGTTKWVVTGLAASKFGAIYQIIAGSQGRLYFAFRLHNGAGWSVWTDGNDTPSTVVDYVDTEASGLADTGPPSGWAVQVIPGIAAGTCRVVASRPTTNGKKILFAFFQIKDSTTGSWRNVNVASGVAGSSTVLYDGSAQAHIYDPVNNTITIGPGGPANFGSTVAANGGLLLMDVRTGNFAQDHCVLIGISPAQVSGNKLLNAGLTPITGTPDGGGLYQDCRIQIVLPPWMWTAEGYQGAQAGLGMCMKDYWKDGGDKDTQTFEGEDIPYDSGVAFTHLEGRVWFANSYSFSDDATYSPVPIDPGVAAQPGTVVLPYAASLSIDCNLGNIFFVVLTGNATLQPLVNAKYLRPIILVVQQGGSGGYTLSLDASYQYGTDIPTCPLSTAVGQSDLFGFMQYAAGSATWIVAFIRGYAA
jgi:hypothetical protein